MSERDRIPTLEDRIRLLEDRVYTLERQAVLRNSSTNSDNDTETSQALVRTQQ